MEVQIYTPSDGRSITRSVGTECTGIRPVVLSRYAIGYVLHGRKLIYDGDECRSVVSCDLFYLGIGHRLFLMPPHRWFIRQRLIHARLLLISTSMSISEIGVACAFSSTSHFIKLFKREYGQAPAAYRSSYRQTPPPEK